MDEHVFKDETALKDLQQLIDGLPIRLDTGPAGPRLTGITDDSRRVRGGELFIARRGTASDGAEYLKNAAQNGASAVLCAAACDLPDDVTQLITEDPAALTAELAERFYDYPSRQLKLIGITGTNGKTTVAYMTRHLLNAAGRKCGMMTTVEVDDGSAKPQAALLTTPGACEISATLARMVANGCEACVMEASSHALDQGRCDALDFDTAVFTNLTGDHLDYHETMEAYAGSKKKLFNSLKPDATALINHEDPYRDEFCAACSCEYTTYGLTQGADYRGEFTDAVKHGDGFAIHGPVDTWYIDERGFIGQHNYMNLLAAVGAAWHGVSVDAAVIAGGIEGMPAVPGRLERVTERDAPFTVLVDYAHTDDALQNVLEALQPFVGKKASLRVLFGCGGDRDKTKRPRMAQVACELADAVVVTSDNPRTEDPTGIIDDVMAGVPEAKAACVQRITDRREAIEKIINDAEAGDTVLIAGKGHEDYQVIGAEKRPFDDRVIAREVLAGKP